ncbi:MAG: Chemotaxis protein CheA [Betaproteobacteria bacterium ADurb.Bin341]|nr:MAG: Chemotaxis protein CheA [Betaproteobacteria bacterium ADurb.Bin341]
MLNFELGKYRKMVVAIALFLVFDLGVLVLSFAISAQIRDDAIDVNLVSRQRMLTQRITKTALQLEQRIKNNQPYRDHLLELEQATSTFDKTLQAYRSGGMVPVGDGKEIMRNALTDKNARQLLDDTLAQWESLREVLHGMLRANPISPNLAASVARQTEAANDRLLAATNNFTLRVQELAESKATSLRIVQVAGIALAVLNFLVILFHFIPNLRANDKELQRVKRETDNILRTTQEGLFLLDPDFRMGSQQSRALTSIFGSQPQPGTDFLSMMRPLVSPKTLDTAREYINLLLKHDVMEKLVSALNPLDRVEMTVNNDAVGVDTRYLQFNFSRVVEDNRVTQLLVTATDITRRVRLEKELKDSEERAQGQMSLLLKLLQADPVILKDFFKVATEALDQINHILETQAGQFENFASKVIAIHRISHRIKGDASSLGLQILEQSFHELEEVLVGMREQKNLSGEDLLPVAVRIKALYSNLDLIQNAVNRMSQIRGVVSVEPSKPPHDPEIGKQAFVTQWRNFVETLAQRQGKSVALNYQGIDVTALPQPMRGAVSSIVNQFLRNALVHGIEAGETRAAHGKSPTGSINIFISENEEGDIELSFRDDGQGIDFNAIRAAAVRVGRLSPEAAEKADMRTLAATIFDPGVSTSKITDKDAGRGAGLDAVKDMVRRMGGNIRVGTTFGQYCHFRVFLPRSKQQHHVAIPALAEAK